MDDAIISAYVLIKKRNTKLISDREELLLKKAISHLMSNTRYIHYGVYEAFTTQDYESAIKNIGRHDSCESDRIITYSMSVMKNPPERIVEMTKSALNKRNEAETILSKSINKLEELTLSINDNKIKKKSDISLADLLNKPSKAKSPLKVLVNENSEANVKSTILPDLLDLKKRS